MVVLPLLEDGFHWFVHLRLTRSIVPSLGCRSLPLTMTGPAVGVGEAITIVRGLVSQIFVCIGSLLEGRGLAVVNLSLRFYELGIVHIPAGSIRHHNVSNE